MHVRNFTLSAALALAPLALGDAPGSLSGTVRTVAGAALTQLPLRLIGAAGEQRVFTGPEGDFVANDLPPGEYRVEVVTPGFVVDPATVTIAAGPARVDLKLGPAPVREQVLVAATRSESSLSTLGTSASVLDAEAIEARQAPALLTLLQDLPGVAIARTGGVGAQGSAFVRGGDSRYARISIDGVPVNQPGGAFDLGTALPFELSRVELVRGAASSLYGTDALAGVLNLVTVRSAPGAGAGLRAEAEGGSFAWQRYTASTSGTHSGLDWNLGGQRLATDNETPNSDFLGWSGALSGGARLGQRGELRLVARLDDTDVGTPGQTAFGRPDLDARFARTDFVLGANLKFASGSLVHVFHTGLATTDQLSTNPLDSGSYTPSYAGRTAPFAFSDFPNSAGYQNDTERTSAGYQAEWQASASHLLTGGLEVERETGSIGTPGTDLLEPERTNFGAYVQDRIVIRQRAFLTLGARVENNDNYGTEVVPRAALAVHLREGQDGTTLRSSFGLGVKEPSFLETFGVSFYATGNPDLKPERSRTFDVGLEQRFLQGRARVEATGFFHEYRDQVAYFVKDYATFEGSYTNLGRTRARGLELGLALRPVALVEFGGAYTFLDGEILESGSAFDPVYAVGQQLLRRPRHQVSLRTEIGGARLAVGATLVSVSSRQDSDFSSLDLTRNEGYTRFDLRVRAALGAGFTAFATADNLFDASYMEALGYPALGRSLRLGLRFRGERRR